MKARKFSPDRLKKEIALALSPQGANRHNRRYLLLPLGIMACYLASDSELPDRMRANWSSGSLQYCLPSLARDATLQRLNPSEAAEVRRIRRFCQHMDSLATDSQGRVVYDSLLKCRPGLLDSAKALLFHLKTQNYEGKNQ